MDEKAFTTCLWFDTQGEAAADFYVSVFKGARIKTVTRYCEGGPGVPGSVLTVEFELNGQPFLALNGGPQFTFNEAVSLVIPCADQAEVDYYWSALGDGGQEGPCGWLKDRFGLSWQVVPTMLPGLLGGPDPAGAKRATEAMMAMGRLDIAALARAYAGD